MAAALALLGWFGLACLLYLLYKLQWPTNHAYMSKMVAARGPYDWPLIGHIVPSGLRGATKYLHRIEKENPSPMYTKLGPIYNVVIFDADSVEAVLSDSTNLRKSFSYNFLWPWFGQGLLTSYGSQWHRQRKLLTPSFHFRILNDFVPIMNEAAVTLVQTMRTKTSEQQGKAWDVCNMITLATLDIIMETSMGQKINAQKDPKNAYVKAIADFSEYITLRITRPWLWLAPLLHLSPVGKTMRDAIRVLKHHSETVVNQRQEVYLQDSHNSNEPRRLAFLDHLLKLKFDGEIPSEEVREQVDTFMFEGHDTTSHAIMWAVHCLAKHVDIQAEVRKELNDLLGADPTVCPTPEQITQMRLLDACIKETLRLFPSVPIVARSIDKDFNLRKDDLMVPAGTQLAIDFYSLHRDPKHFPDPERFDPSRFSAEQTTGRHPFCYVPFAGGPRNCIGQRFAMNEMRIVLCHLLRNFEFTTTQSSEECEPAYQMILQPTAGIWISTRDLVES